MLFIVQVSYKNIQTNIQMILTLRPIKHVLIGNSTHNLSIHNVVFTSFQFRRRA